MKKIVYSPHLKFRMRLREISDDLPKKIYKEPDEKYRDSITSLLIAIGKAKYKSRMREFALTYKETDKEVLLITVHPLKSNQKQNRIKSKRWLKI